MAISNLHCERTAEGILLRWDWEPESDLEKVHIKVVRLLDKKVGGSFQPIHEADYFVKRYRSALASGNGIRIPCGEIPLFVEVEDKSGLRLEETLEDRLYPIRWGIERETSEVKTGFFKKEIRSRYFLRVDFGTLDVRPSPDLIGYQIGKNQLFFPELNVGVNRFAISSEAAAGSLKVVMNKTAPESSLFEMQRMP